MTDEAQKVAEPAIILVQQRVLPRLRAGMSAKNRQKPSIADNTDVYFFGGCLVSVTKPIFVIPLVCAAAITCAITSYRVDLSARSCNSGCGCFFAACASFASRSV